MKKQILSTFLLLALGFSVGMAIAHYTLPEKARLSKEEAQHLVSKKWGTLGYDKPQDHLFENKNAIRDSQ